MRHVLTPDSWSPPLLRSRSAVAVRWRARRTTVRRTSGFSLIELTIAVLILGILAGVAAPKYVDWQQRTQNAAIYRNVQRICDAAETYLMLNGSYPKDVNPGILPSELADVLPSTLFANERPFGGKYDWNGLNTKMECFGVSLQHDNVDAEVLKAWTAFDREFDDGNLKQGGVFRSTHAPKHLLIQLRKNRQ
jgi:prepilin-type N-terminal cleavage/methylation domain-containing protein